MTRKLIALPLAATLMAAGPALAQQVGTASAVNPVSEVTAPGGATDKLAVGARAMHNERIRTFALWIGAAFVSRQELAQYRVQHQSRDRRLHLRGHAGQADDGHAAIYRRPIKPSGRRHNQHAGGGGRHPRHRHITHGANGTQITNQYGTITLTNAVGTTVVTQPGYTVRVADRKSPPGQPMRVTADEVDRNIKKLSSRFGQDGGVKGLKRIDTAGLNCATHATSTCPQTPGLSAVANDAAQIIMQSTQRATPPMPPTPPSRLR